MRRGHRTLRVIEDFNCRRLWGSGNLKLIERGKVRSILGISMENIILDAAVVGFKSVVVHQIQLGSKDKGLNNSIAKVGSKPAPMLYTCKIAPSIALIKEGAGNSKDSLNMETQQKRIDSNSNDMPMMLKNASVNIQSSQMEIGGQVCTDSPPALT